MIPLCCIIYSFHFFRYLKNNDFAYELYEIEATKANDYGERGIPLPYALYRGLILFPGFLFGLLIGVPAMIYNFFRWLLIFVKLLPPTFCFCCIGRAV